MAHNAKINHIFMFLLYSDTINSEVPNATLLLHFTIICAFLSFYLKTFSLKIAIPANALESVFLEYHFVYMNILWDEDPMTEKALLDIV